ncbi:unnamed protein product, partial [Owenia fusiformis]
HSTMAKFQVRLFIITFFCLTSALIFLILQLWKNYSTFTNSTNKNDVERVILESSIKIDELITQHEPSTPNPYILMYNGLSTCGSSWFIANLKALSIPNGFTFIHQESRGRKLIKEPYYYTNELLRLSNETPLAKYHDVYFLNFKSYNYSNPIYVNIAREPYDRAEATYTFHRFTCKRENRFCTAFIYEMQDLTFEECLTKWHNATHICGSFFRESMRVFCGHHQVCLDDKMSHIGVQLAKANIARYYTFVGLYEEYQASMLALEELIPTYFAGTASRYSRKTEEGVKAFPDIKTEKIIKEVLKYDYEVYHFIKQRFYQTIGKLGLVGHLKDIHWVP